MKKIMPLILCCLFCFFIVGCGKDETKDFTFELSNDEQGYIVTSYNGSKTEIKIPKKYQGKNVIGIGENAFSNVSITSIFIPETILEISTISFSNYKDLASIQVDGNNRRYASIDGILYSKSKEILYHYPRGLKEKSIEIPSHVMRIGSYAFQNNDKVKHITFLGNLKAIETGAFSNCSILRTIYIPSTLTSMGSYVFSKSNPELVVHIPDVAMTTGWNQKWKDDFDGTIRYDNGYSGGEIK